MNILILSATASSINLINSLRTYTQYKLFVTDCSKYAFGLYEKDVKGILIPLARDLKSYENKILSIIKKENIDIMIPTSDHDVEAITYLMNNGTNFNVKIFYNDLSIHSVLNNKDLLYQYIKKHHLDVMIPQQFNKNKIKNSDYPLVLKPTLEGGSKDIFTVSSKTELNKAIIFLEKKYNNNYVIQEYIPGGRETIFVALLLFGKDKKLYKSAVSKSTLTFMSWGGGGNAGLIEDNEHLINDSLKIINHLGGWEGPINFEFKKSDKNGKFYLLESNCRLNGYSYLTTMNKCNFPKSMIDLLLEKDVKKEHLRHGNKRFIISLREEIIEEWKEIED